MWDAEVLHLTVSVYSPPPTLHPRLIPLGHILTEEVRRGGSCQRLPAACKRDCSQHLHQQLHSRWQRSHWLVTSHLHKLQPQRLPRQLLASLGKPDPDSSEPKDSRLSHLKKKQNHHTKKHLKFESVVSNSVTQTRGRHNLLFFSVLPSAGVD